MKLEKGNIQIVICQSQFVKEKHLLEFFKGIQSQLIKIDGIEIFGTDGAIPEMEYKSIQIEIGKVRINLPESALKNLFEPNLENSTAHYDDNNMLLPILRTAFSSS